jgi:hypothetical protein
MSNPVVCELDELSGIVLPPLDACFEDRVCQGCDGDDDGDYHSELFDIELLEARVTGKRKLFLARFKRPMTGEEVEKAVVDMPTKRLALWEDLLGVSAHPEHRKLQREFSIYCLDPSLVVFGRRIVFCFKNSGESWGLPHQSFRTTRHTACRYLLVDESSQ